jgi:hypothetical protein
MAQPGGELHPRSHNFSLLLHIYFVWSVTSLFTALRPTCANVSTHSTNSIDEILNGDDVDLPEDAWKTELNTRVEQITNLKRSSTEGRTESLLAYAHILMARYAKEDIEGHVSELVASMIRSIRQETTEREAVVALKGILTIILHHNLD